MDRYHRIARGTLILTLFSFASRFLGMWFRLYLTARIGSEGIGLYQVTMSVYTLFATFATAGFSIAVSRLVSERMVGDKTTSSGRRVCNKCMAISTVIAFFGMVILFFFSELIASKILGESEVASSIRILSLSMVFIAPCSCIKGYFLSEGRAWKNATAMVFEQLVKIAVSVLFFSFVLTKETSPSALCHGIVWGTTIGEAASFIFLLLVYWLSPYEKEKSPVSSVGAGELFRLISPLAAGSYVTTLLHSGEGILIPQAFAISSGDKAASLAAFGVIRGMTVPLLFFPFAFLSSFVSLLAPKVTQHYFSKRKENARSIVERMMGFSWMVSVAFGCIFFIFAKEFSLLFYRSLECVSSIRILSLVLPMMYLETISASLLNGIGEQSFTLRCNVYNSFLRILFIVLFIPKLGVNGYLWLLVGSNVFTFLLCYCRLKRRIGFHISVSKRAFALLGASTAIGLLLHHLSSVLGDFFVCVIGSGTILAFCLVLILHGKLNGFFKREGIDNGA